MLENIQRNARLFWYFLLPAFPAVLQLMPADGMVIKVIALVEKRNVLTWATWTTFAGFAPIAFLAFFIFDTKIVVRAVNVVTATVAIIAVSGSLNQYYILPSRWNNWIWVRGLET